MVFRLSQFPCVKIFRHLSLANIYLDEKRDVLGECSWEIEYIARLLVLFIKMFSFLSKFDTYRSILASHFNSSKGIPSPKVKEPASHDKKDIVILMSNFLMQAVSNLQPLVCRIHFLDGKIKAVGVQPFQTVEDVLAVIQDKIGLQNVSGWALYEVYIMRQILQM